MLINAEEFAQLPAEEFHFCVIGSGPAGMAVSLELSRRGHRVLLLEQGGVEDDAKAQDLAIGEVSGDMTQSRPDYAVTSRKVMLGGSTNCWTGNCHPFLKSDFEVREWIRHSGWPIDLATLQPFYGQSLAFLGINRNVQASLDQGDLAMKKHALFKENFELHRYIDIPGDRRFLFQSKRNDIASSEQLLAVHHSPCIGLETASDGTSIQHVLVDVGMKRIKVRARNYILAGGALENARLLLLLRLQSRSAVGNEHDQVGRYLMEHPTFDGFDFFQFTRDAGTRKGTILSTKGSLWRDAMIKNHYVFTGTESFCCSRQIARFSCRLLLSLPDKTVSEESFRTLKFVMPDEAPDEKQKVALAQMLRVRLEQAPNPESRVVLSRNIKDRFDRPVLNVHWRYSELDVRTAHGAVSSVIQSLGAQSIGLVRMRQKLEDLFPSFVQFASHPMGTTRMSNDAKQGVVDSNCRVHGVNNLFIAGSSVFPTGSCFNPTLTLIALSFRLADHLDRDLKF